MTGRVARISLKSVNGKTHNWRKSPMRVIILSALLGLGIGLAGVPAANAAPISGLSTAVEGSLIQDVQYYRRCRSIRVCRRGPWGRRCHIERVCRRGW
jgi:hypothetical protein